MIVCEKCKFENRENARFCKQCGANLDQFGKSQSADLGSDPLEEKVSEDKISEETFDTRPEPEELPLTEPVKEDANFIIAEESPESQKTSNQIELSENDTGDVEDNKQKEPPSEDKVKETGDQDTPEPGDDSILTVESNDLDKLDTILEPVLPPLEPGARLAERYEIVALLEETRETLLYDALDFGRCSQCNYGDSMPGDTFCANCGASLTGPDSPPHVYLRSLKIAGEAVIRLEEETDGKIESWFEADGRLYAILPVKKDSVEETTEPPSFTRGVRHIVGYSSDEGLQRKLNEDAMLAITLAPTLKSQTRPSLGLYAVADGMGGHASGEVASKLAIEGLADTIVKRLLLAEMVGEAVLPETPAAMLTDAIQAINNRIFELQQTTGSDMGTTFTCALLRDSTATIANIGDSRTYLWRDGHLIQLTVDHSLVAELVAAGAIEPDDIYTHPEKSAIYRSLGHSFTVQVDIFTQSIEPGDRLLLCSDGAWEMLRHEGIEEVLLTEHDPQRACDEIVRRSNLAGGEDNISVIIVQFECLGN
ncbi:MAG: protein phosphatase 2C domain-containing protein [Anaerolineales bacterium]|nr:protein phosphatase 2C domain-containing protein [Anaerolineales bacterium]